MATYPTDFSFQIGSFRDMNLLSDDERGEYAKLNALINLLHTFPGTLQDCPGFGIDAIQYLYTEGEEIDLAIQAMKTDIMQQADTYISRGFVTEIKVEINDGAHLGAKDISMEILTRGKFLKLESSLNKEGMKLKKAYIDSSKFILKSN